MGADIEYLLTFLKDELGDIEDLRIAPTFPSTTQKSLDLPQDYDPESSDVHLKRGVTVRAKSREYFFNASWVQAGQFELIRAQAKEIRDFCF